MAKRRNPKDGWVDRGDYYEVTLDDGDKMIVPKKALDNLRKQLYIHYAMEEENRRLLGLGEKK